MLRNHKIRAVAIALGTVAALFLLRACDEAPEPLEFKVTVKDVRTSLVERGPLVSLDSPPVAIEMSGEIVEIATSGTPVKQGEIIVRMDDTLARDRLDQVKFNTHQAEQNKASGEADYAYQQCVESNRLALLEKRLESARINEKEARIGLKPEERRLLEIEREIASLDLSDAEDEFTRQKRLFDKGFISALMLEPYERGVSTRKAALNEIDARIRLEEKGVPEEELLELRKSVERLEGMLARGEKAAERRLEYVQRTIDVAQARLEENFHDREQVDDDLAATEVKAPKDGILSVRLHHEQQVGRFEEYKPGVSARKYDLLADIVNPGEFKVELMIHEADIDRVKKGSRANIQLPAFPAKTFTGRVMEVGGVGRDRADVAPRGYESGRAGVSMFNVAVSLEGNGVEFRPGMSAIVEMLIGEPQRCTVLPRAAVLPEPDGSWFVWRGARNKLHKQPVKGRALNAFDFLVEEGVAEGESVFVPVPREES